MKTCNIIRCVLMAVTFMQLNRMIKCQSNATAISSRRLNDGPTTENKQVLYPAVPRGNTLLLGAMFPIHIYKKTIITDRIGNTEEIHQCHELQVRNNVYL